MISTQVASTSAEIAVMHWLSAGKQPNGMVIRMQGFDRGLFGGNFHTHNWLPLLPGVDVVATSTGRDYARAMRHAVRQARAGRVGDDGRRHVSAEPASRPRSR